MSCSLCHKGICVCAFELHRLLRVLEAAEWQVLGLDEVPVLLRKLHADVGEDRVLVLAHDLRRLLGGRREGRVHVTLPVALAQRDAALPGDALVHRHLARLNELRQVGTPGAGRVADLLHVALEGGDVLLGDLPGVLRQAGLVARHDSLPRSSTAAERARHPSSLSRVPPSKGSSAGLSRSPGRHRLRRKGKGRVVAPTRRLGAHTQRQPWLAAEIAAAGPARGAIADGVGLQGPADSDLDVTAAFELWATLVRGYLGLLTAVDA